MKTNKHGFTLVELLVVLLIIAILAAVATPLYLANANRARASEAVATMSLIRQAERDFRINNNLYFDVPALATTGNIWRGLPPLSAITAAGGGVAPASTYGVDVNAGVAQYFSNSAYSIDSNGVPGNLGTGASGLFTSPNAVDFIISANGNASISCDTAADTENCAIKANQIRGTGALNSLNSVRVEMDNSGRIFVCYSNCGTAANWSAY